MACFIALNRLSTGSQPDRAPDREGRRRAGWRERGGHHAGGPARVFEGVAARPAESLWESHCRVRRVPPATGP